MNKERTANIVQGFSPVILQTFKKKCFTVFVQCILFLGTIFHSAQVLIDNPREKSEKEYCMFFFFSARLCKQ